MLLTLSMAVLLSGAPQGKMLSVEPLEVEGAAQEHLSAVYKALVQELTTQGYGVLPLSADDSRRAGVVGGALVQQKGTFEITLRLTDTKTKAVISAVSVRCGTAEKLPDAAREAAQQVAREGRQQWGMRTRFKPAK